MTPKEMGKKWNCTEHWVRQRCVEGMIPLAEKTKRKWDIPETVSKPPCTRHRAVTLLKLLMQSAEGDDVELFPGNDIETNIEIYNYLAGNGFITKLKHKNIEKDLKNAKVLKAGIELIDNATEKKKIVSKKTKVTAEADFKKVKVKVEHERNNQPDIDSESES